MLKALKWTLRSLRTHSWPRTQEERQTLEDIIDRKVPLSSPVPFSQRSLKRLRGEERRQSKAAKNNLRARADTTASPTEQPHDGKAVGSANSISQPESGPRRIYWRPTLPQLQVLVAVFQKSPHPSSSLYSELSERLQVPLKSIIHWFSNRRSRGLSSQIRLHVRSPLRPKDTLVGITTEAKRIRINDRPPVRTLDLSQVTASDFVDLSGIQLPYIPVIVGAETLTGKPTYDTTKQARRVAFPTGTTGFFYLHAPADRPAYERSIRFKLVPSIDHLEDLHNHSDLLKRDGLPWSIPMWTEDCDTWPFIAKTVNDGFIDEDMHRRFSSLANESPRIGRGAVIHNMSQVFAVHLDRDKITIWFVTDETKTRIILKTTFLGEFKRNRDGSEAGCALVSIKPHPVYNALALVVESVQGSKGSPQVKVPTPTYTLLSVILLERMEYKLDRRRALRT